MLVKKGVLKKALAKLATVRMASLNMDSTPHLGRDSRGKGGSRETLIRSAICHLLFDRN